MGSIPSGADGCPHYGVLLRNYEFKVLGNGFQFCLLHVLRRSDDNGRGKIDVFFCKDEDLAIRRLQFWTRDADLQRGDPHVSTKPLRTIAGELHHILGPKFRRSWLAKDRCGELMMIIRYLRL